MYALAVLGTPQQGAWYLHCRPPAFQAPPDSAACSRMLPEPPASQGASDAGWTPSAPLLLACGTVPRFDAPPQCCRWSLVGRTLHWIAPWSCSLQRSSYHGQNCLERLVACRTQSLRNASCSCVTPYPQSAEPTWALLPQASTRRLAALPAFQPSDGPGGKAAALARAPLEPRLAAARDDLAAQAAAQLRSADELLDALQV
jgi:hypothetical protein